ncbi:hypothetical protein [Streptomyces sp. NPDC054784]
MRRTLLSAGAWTAATGAAVTLSWFAVHTMLAGTAYDPPRALPVSEAAASQEASDGATPRSSSTHRPRPSGSGASPDGGSEKPSGTSGGGEDGDGDSGKGGTGGGADDAGSTPRDRPTHTESPAAPTTPEGNIRSYSVEGGRVAFDLRQDSADLVSATPNPGWDMQVWEGEGWIRVTFTGSGGSRSTSVFCTWNGHPPMIEHYEEG